MDARDHSVLIFPTKRICSLEWITWAMDAARQYTENRDRDVVRDMRAFYLTEQLPVA